MFDGWFATQKPTVTAWFHELHRHPELGFQEQKTAAFVETQLRSFGLTPETGIGGTGVIATLVGTRGPGRSIGLRAELDALPMQEENGLSYASRETGKAHMCGHDGHCVTLLTAAQYLTTHPDFEGTVHFIFQPAEELLEGAQAMIADGLFERFPCDEIYALHNMPGLEKGAIGVPVGAAMASADAINITIHAKGTHGAAPHTGADGVLAAASFITSVEQIATRVFDARQAGVISFGAIHGGTVRNILPAEVRIEGTLRTNNANARENLIAAIDRVARGTETTHSVTIDAEVIPMAPVAINDPIASEAVAFAAETALGADHVIRNAAPIMASEDFAFMLEQVPGSFFFVGQDGPFPHHPAYIFDPDVIPTGAAVFVELVKQRGTSNIHSTHCSADNENISNGRTL